MAVKDARSEEKVEKFFPSSRIMYGQNPRMYRTMYVQISVMYRTKRRSEDGK